MLSFLLIISFFSLNVISSEIDQELSYRASLRGNKEKTDQAEQKASHSASLKDDKEKTDEREQKVSYRASLINNKEIKNQEVSFSSKLRAKQKSCFNLFSRKK